MGFTKDFFIYLSKNKMLNDGAKRWGLKMGAQNVVAGTNIDEMMESVKQLNKDGISATIDNLGEFVYEKHEAIAAKEQIIQVVEAIRQNAADAHISMKPTQLGLDIDFDFCLENIREIGGKANEYGIFINLDMEDHAHVEPSFMLFDQLSEEYDNIGTVIQAYFLDAEKKIEKYQNNRLRIVKGAYKEPAELAYQDKKDIDENFLKLIEFHLLHGRFTSVATHDHKIIEHVKKFASHHKIPKEKFEFQMLYGFRIDMQRSLAKEGYQFCTYVPFGKDWYGYFMRRLAERPQNVHLIVKQVFTTRTKAAIGIGVGAFILGRMSKRKKM